jgi:hypothetical protein
MNTQSERMMRRWHERHTKIPYRQSFRDAEDTLALRLEYSRAGMMAWGMVSCPNCGGDDVADFFPFEGAYQHQCMKCWHIFRYTDDDWSEPGYRIRKKKIDDVLPDRDKTGL